MCWGSKINSILLIENKGESWELPFTYLRRKVNHTVKSAALRTGRFCEFNLIPRLDHMFRAYGFTIDNSLNIRAQVHQFLHGIHDGFDVLAGQRHIEIQCTIAEVYVQRCRSTVVASHFYVCFLFDVDCITHSDSFLSRYRVFWFVVELFPTKVYSLLKNVSLTLRLL